MRSNVWWKMSLAYVKEGQSEIERKWKLVNVTEVQIEHVTGKAAIEMINGKNSRG